MSTRVEWAVLADRAKDLDVQAAEMKRSARATIAKRFPEVGKRQFGNLVWAAKSGALRAEVTELINEHQDLVAAVEREAWRCREQSERLRQELIAADKRPWLDPRIDVIPLGPYPKLRQCRTFPLRLGCDHGDSATSRWRRCEFMDYDRTKGPFDPARWRCTAKE